MCVLASRAVPFVHTLVDVLLYVVCINIYIDELEVAKSHGRITGPVLRSRAPGRACRFLISESVGVPHYSTRYTVSRAGHLIRNRNKSGPG